MKIKTVMALVIAFIFLSSVSVSAAPDMAHADSLKELKDQKIIESTLKTPSEKAKYTFEVTDKIKTDAKSTITVSTEKGKLKLKSNSGKHEVQNLQIAYSLLAPYIVDGAVRIEHKTDSGITDAVWVQKVRNDNGYVYFDNVPFSEIIIGGYTGTYAKTGIMNYSVSNVFNLGSSFRANSTNFINAAVMPQYEEDSPYDIPMNGLVGWWKFDEGSGTLVADSAGNHDGTASGGMTWTDGDFEGSGHFDGVNDYVTLSNIVNFSNTNFSMSCIIKPEANTTTIFGQNDASNAPQFRIAPTGVIEMYVSGAGQLSSDTPISLNMVHHIVYTYDKTTDVIKLYDNGVFLKSALATIEYENSPIQYIGKRSITPQYFKGDIYSLEFYDRALTDIEVTQIYREMCPYNVPTDGLVGFWSFDEGTGTVVNDISGNGNHGTASGMTWTDGKYNGAGSFDGVDDYVGCGNILDQGENSFSLCAIINTTETVSDNGDAIINKKSTAQLNNSGYMLHLVNGYILVKLGDGENGVTCIDDTKKVNDGTQHTIITTIDRTNKIIKIYFDGILTKSANIPDQLQNINSSFPLTFCALDGGDNRYSVYKGDIDNVIIYNRALTDSEIKQIYYDSIEDLQLKTNSGSTYSSQIDGSGEVSIPYDSGDADITSLTAYVPESVTIGGVTVRDYNRTVTPFSIAATVGYTENTTLISESIVNNVYNLNISYSPSGNSTGNLSYTTAELGSYDWLGNIEFDSDDSGAAVSSWNATSFEIQTGSLTAGQAYQYNVTVDVYNTPVAEFEAENTVGYHTITTEFTDLSTNSPTSWLWDFGDGSTSTSQNPTHTYAAGGYYTVTLTATNPAGHDTETKTNVIHVIPPVQDTIDSSFVDSWHDTISLVGAIMIVTLAGSAIMVFKGRKSMLDVEYDMQGIVLVLVLMVLGAIIFGQF